MGATAPVDMPLAVVDAVNTATPATYFVHTDHLNRPVRMTNAAKAAVWQALWKPFGEVQAITGTASLDARFPGQWFQIESGLAYNWHRYYDATTGRYTQADPLGFVDGPGVFGYAGSAATMWADPFGLYTEIIIWAPAPGAIGSSSFGHVSVDINGHNFSLGRHGWDSRGIGEFIGVNSGFRGGEGYVLNLTAEQEETVRACLASWTGEWMPRSNNCTRPIQGCLRRAGITDLPDTIWPKRLEQSLQDSDLVTRTRPYRPRPN
jgi:RHS repeat-associated protein